MRFPLDPPGRGDGEVTVTPFTAEDAAELFAAVDDDGVWAHIPTARPQTQADLAALLTGSSTRQPFAVRNADRVVGTSSFHFDPAEASGIEMGSTLLAPAVWGTGVNGAAKRLLLGAAFAAGAEWVRLRTDERNLRSAAAILKLPGVVEMSPQLEPQWVRPDGTVRTSRMFRIQRPG